MIGITVLGATGSIGVSTLDVISRHRDRFKAVALTANSDVDTLFMQCQLHRPEFAVMAQPEAARDLKQRLASDDLPTKVLSGKSALEEVAELSQCDTVVAAIVGAAGLNPTLAAARAGKRILLANKEALVMSGKLFMETVHQYNAELLPIDSEHNAIFQCMPQDIDGSLEDRGIRRILLTASGGPFLNMPVNEMANVTPEQAIAHPNWDMGRKISVDSATMMNKGLEVIEAHWLFNATSEQIDVAIHPQSVVHSMVEYVDGSLLAQLGQPDMRTPIAYALSWPDRMPSGVERLDLFKLGSLEFLAPDMARFPCLELAYEALKAGGTAPAILNAANEIAVRLFLDNQLKYNEIYQLVHSSLEAIEINPADSLEAIFDADSKTRRYAERFIGQRSMRQAAQ